MICLLPTRSSRRYRGKYPTRVNMWSYSRSASQKIVGDHLSMQRPCHIELNDGRRYIADLPYLIKLDFDGICMGMDLAELVSDSNEMLFSLTQDRYDAMLADIRKLRDAEQAAMSGVIIA